MTRPKIGIFADCTDLCMPILELADALEESRSWPKPLQQPHPPVLLGVPPSERNFRRIATWADGWIPMGSKLMEPVFQTWLEQVALACDEVSRDPATVRITALCTDLGPDQLAAAVARAEALGVERILLKTDDGPAERVLPWLDRLAKPLAPLLTQTPCGRLLAGAQ